MADSDTNLVPQPWHALQVSAVAEAVSSSERGLASSEAGSRLASVGPNRIERKQDESLLMLLWRQINNPLIWVLLASTVVAVVSLGKVTDGLVVLAVVILNAIVGMVQEYRAGKAIEELAVFSWNVESTAAENLAQSPFDAVGGVCTSTGAPMVTVSIGITSFGEPPATVSEALAAADAAMYEAKTAGKGQIKTRVQRSVATPVAG